MGWSRSKRRTAHSSGCNDGTIDRLLIPKRLNYHYTEPMKAIIVTKAGSLDVLKLQEVKKPIPKENEILVKVKAATVTRGDVALRKLPRALLFIVGILAGFKAQKISGVEFAGIVEATGNNVQRFKIGDEVFGTTTGLAYGANAEYVCVPESWKQGVVATKPQKLSFQQAAALPVGGMT